MSARYTVLITGAASGIGRCFALHYLKQPGTNVIAVDRNSIDIPDPSGDQQFRTLHVDMGSTDSIKGMVKQIEGLKIDLVIHSAGIRGLVPEVESKFPDDVAAAETFQVMNPDTMMRTFQINTVGTFVLLQELSRFFRATEGNVGAQPNDSLLAGSRSKVVVMTSRMGSISYNTAAGGAYAYRASKAALNAVVKSMSIDLPHVTFALLHPGRVETRLTKCREEGAIDVEESVADMLQFINGMRSSDSGRFVDRFGKDIGW